MAKKIGCPSGVKIRNTCVKQGDFINLKTSTGPAHYIKWGEYEQKINSVQRGYYFVKIIAPNDDLIIAVADPFHKPPIISSKHIYKIKPKDLRKTVVKKVE